MPVDNSVALQIKAQPSGAQSPDAVNTLARVQQLKNQMDLQSAIKARATAPSAFPSSPQAFPDPVEAGPG